MINSKNIKIIVLIFLVSFFLAEMVYFISQDRKEEKPVQDEEIFKKICFNEEFRNYRLLEENKAYINAEDNREYIGCLYNQYLFCNVFKREGDNIDNELNKMIRNAEGLPTLNSIKSVFTRTKAFNNVFRIKDCSDERALSLVEETINAMISEDDKEYSLGIKKEIFCELLIDSNSDVEIIENSCNSVGCRSFFNRDADGCQAIEDESQRNTCTDLVSYIKALDANDREYCSEINNLFYQTACQAYFIDDNPNMCDAIANDIHEICRK